MKREKKTGAGSGTRRDREVKPEKEERRYGSFWICPNCEGSPEFEHTAMMKHLQEVHGIDPEHFKGTRRATCHLDGADFYAWEWEWEINGLKFHQATCEKRTGADAAFWADGE